MPKVHLTFPPFQGGAGVLTVDDVDLSRVVMRDGFQIDFTTEPPQVTVRICATELEVDLPESVVAAERSAD